MLYLLRAEGLIEELAEANHGELDENSGAFICFDSRGEEVARYPKLAISMFSSRPFPEEPITQAGLDLPA